MRPELSLYLDAVRFTAALTVFLSHFALHRLSGGFLWQLNPLGNEAVTVFFVLSGFVIAHACDVREPDARSYVINRAARLYSVALPAVLLTAALDALGRHWRPELYGADWGYVQDYSILRFLAALTFTNQLWFASVQQGSNAAYWSMGYEVPYYLIFGLATYTPPRWRWGAVVAGTLLAGPSIVASMPIWLAGVFAYRRVQRSPLSERSGLLLFAATLLCWVVYEVLVGHLGRPLWTPGPWHKRAEMMQDWIVATFFVLNLIGFSAAARPLGSWLLRHAGLIRWLAGATFTLYLCHLPVAQFLLACVPWPATDPRSRVIVFVGTLLVVFLLAALFERRKTVWRKAFSVLWPAPRPSPSLT